MSANAVYRLPVRVIDAAGCPLPGVQVDAFNWAPKAHVRIGSAHTDERGLAIIHSVASDFSEHPGERGPDIYFLLLHAGIPLTHRLDDRAGDDRVLRNFQPGAEAVLICVTEELPATKPSLAWVSGTAMDRSGRGLQGDTVSLELVRPGGSTETMGQDVTSAGGRYRIFYERDQALIRNEGRLNLRVTLFRGNKRVFHSPVVQNAPPRVEELDLVVQAKELDGTSGFQRVQRDLSAVAEAAGLDLANLRETASQPDASMLAGESGHPVEKIALFATALRMERDSDG
jgi:hypothetical protein